MSVSPLDLTSGIGCCCSVVTDTASLVPSGNEAVVLLVAMDSLGISDFRATPSSTEAGADVVG